MMEQESHTMNAELLINKVRENKAIYDASDRNHSNRNFIANVWRKIGEELSMPMKKSTVFADVSKNIPMPTTKIIPRFSQNS
ncbi:hypothetical protein TNCT_250811 [Trichonephila clavata]|uniref:MADF domain-containing protein n=1 Tax=Trichonephila clavata TaxID=2740835 RepID=A0A8X6LUI4_TRICU|nr:hypothetical protein TNCT_250811 [Trichonephila clavata]